ncbi:MAG: hypothetical protein AB7T86_03290 [Xanthobacteraceae bacterium]|uniref:hypothetical protein n=1 Tax=Pseudolabrys sp. TaxID=1960880 RepID=UPI003D118E05
MPSFQIPKQTDRSLLAAIQAIKAELPQPESHIVVRTAEGPAGVDVRLNDKPNALVEDVLSLESQIMPHLYLRGPNNHNGLVINRKAGPTDEVQVAHDGNWFSNIQEPERPAIGVRLIASARKHLDAVELDGTISGTADTEWGRYREAQAAIIHGLQETQRTILSEFTRKSLEMEAASKARTENREAELKKHYDTLQEQLNQKQLAESERVAAREKEIEDREKRFNTKEARYVARSEQQNQIAQIKGWLEDWSLTKKTQSKRRVVIAAYIMAAIFTGGLTIWFSRESMNVINTSAATLEWWQWFLLAFKSIFPLAAFITFIVAFIRWSSDWARQHADEEFRNRARILDIGRTAWLLEAVRDAQDNNKELPPELVKELSRNLFAYAPTGDAADLNPNTITDLLMQGLNTLRVKAPDGSEVEARRKG